MRDATASDAMAHPVITVWETADLEQVARLMLEKDIGSVVVVDDEGGMTGIVTDTDFAARKSRIPFSTFEVPQLFGQWMGKDGVEEIYRKAQSMEVGEIMTRRVLSVAEDTPVGDVVRLMLDRAIDHVPVVRDGKPVGMVARWDLLKLLLGRAPGA